MTLRLATLLAFLIVVAAVSVRARESQRLLDAPKPAPVASQRTEPTDIWTDHLKIRTYASQPAIAAGRGVSLVVEIEPGERMHVYAPGADDYRIIALTVATQPSVRLAPMTYPASEIYVFEPLNERIPVYQKPFKLIQEITLDTRPEAQAALRGKPSLTLTGTLDYQACDDKICFNPVKVPLSWTLALGPDATARPGSTPTLR